MTEKDTNLSLIEGILPQGSPGLWSKGGEHNIALKNQLWT